ncbi:ABC-type Mn2+/Zn2+ transport system permease subunit [Paenibacillus sp. OAE614]
MEFLSGILEYGFLQKALLTSVMVGMICGIIGCFIILRGMALMGDAISHAVLPGVALSYMLGINFFFGAVVTGVLTALGIGYVSQNSRIKNDSAIGIVFTSFFAIGIILITFAKSSTDLYHILFGNVLAVRASDMWITLIIGIVIAAVVYLFYKELLVSSFDPVMSAAYGLPGRLIHYLLMTLLTLVTVASLQTVGIILVVAMLITPRLHRLSADQPAVGDDLSGCRLWRVISRGGAVFQRQIQSRLRCSHRARVSYLVHAGIGLFTKTGRPVAAFPFPAQKGGAERPLTPSARKAAGFAPQ